MRYDQCDQTCTSDCGHCKGNGPPTIPHATFEVRAEYDPAVGELSFIDEQTTRILVIRAGFEEAATRRAAIIELERLGYTVIAPVEAMSGCLYGCAPGGNHHPECPNLTTNQEPTE